MAQSMTRTASKPVWIDLTTTDPEGSRAFYSRLFGWQIEVQPDPQFGGYAMARSEGKDVAGISPSMSPDAPTSWMVYVGTDDIDALSAKVRTAGGSVPVAPMTVGDVGRMAIFQDPAGAFIAGWQPNTMPGFSAGIPNSYGWAELSARGIERVLPFYERAFGWTTRASSTGEGQPPYHEFMLDGDSIAGGMEMNPTVPPEVPSYWMVYFSVPDVDGSFRRALDAGATEMMGPSDYSGGRFAILRDPQGAVFGVLKVNQGSR